MIFAKSRIPISIRVRAHQCLRKIQRVTARSVRTIPGIADLLGLPKDKIHSTKNWIGEQNQRTENAGDGSRPRYDIVFPPMSQIPIEPKCPTSAKVPLAPKIQKAEPGRFNYWDIRSGFDSRLGFYRKEIQHYDEVFLAHIPNGFVLGPSGAVLAPDRKLFLESIWTWDDWLTDDRSQISLSLPSPKTVQKACYVAASNQSEGYPHWLMEVLPRLFALKTLPPDERPTLIFNAELCPWQIDSLVLLGFGDFPRMALNDQFLAIESLYFPSYVGVPGTPHPVGCGWVRDIIRKSVEPVGKTRRIYITRRRATKRRVSNEAAILPILEKYGFEVVEAEKLSFAEQVALFSNAEAVVAAHGAGLANLLWAPRGCKILEFLDRDYVNDQFYNLSSIFELDYYYQLCTSVNAAHGKRPMPGRDHIIVDPEKFKTSLRAMVP